MAARELHIAVAASTGEMREEIAEYPLVRDPFILVAPKGVLTDPAKGMDGAIETAVVGVPAEVPDGPAHRALVIDGASNEGLVDALKQARFEGKPVFIDFWASWCKNCKAMDKTTFKDEMVKARLKDYTFIKYIAEDPVNPETKAVMDHFGVQGMPTFIVLSAK